MNELSTLFGLGALSGLLALDATGALQVMLSRPLIAGGLAGLWFGDLGMGLAVGGLVELLWIGTVPVGSVVPPDGTSASVVGAAVAVRLSGAAEGPYASDAAAALGLLASVPVGFLGAKAEIWQRRFNGRLVARADQDLAAGRLPKLGSLMAAALGLAWARATLVCVLGLGVALPFFGWLLTHLPADALLALHWSFWLFWLLALAVVADHFWQRRGLKWAGLAALIVALAGASKGTSQAQVLLLALSLPLAAGLWRWSRALKGEAP